MLDKRPVPRPDTDCAWRQLSGKAVRMTQRLEGSGSRGEQRARLAAMVHARR